MSSNQSSMPGIFDAALFSYAEWRQKFLNLILRGACVVGLFVTITASLEVPAFLAAFYIGSYIAVLILTFVPFSYRVRATGFLLVMYVIAVSTLLETGVRVDARLFLMAFTIIATMLFGTRSGIIAIGIGIGTIAIAGLFILTGRYTLISTITPAGDLDIWIVQTLVLLMLETIIVIGLDRLQRGFGTALQQAQQLLEEVQTERATLEQRVDERTAQIRTSAEVGQTAVAMLDPDQLLRQVVNLIAERFGFYYVTVFTLNDTDTAAVLREATGEAGRALKERGHQVAVNEQSMVGYAITQRKARIALDVGDDPVRLANPLLPETRSEIALPLLAGKRVLGVLDVQSTQAAAFDEASAVVLQSMADQIAVALNNAEQFKQIEQQAKLQSTLNQFTRGLFAASTAEELYHVLATELVNLVPHDRLSLTLAQTDSTTLREYPLQAKADPVLTEGPVWSMTNTLSGRACATRQPVISARLEQDALLHDAAQLELAGFQSALSLPLVVGERVLGTLNFASRKPGAFSPAGSTQLEQLAGQIAIALENQRLAQAQQASLREMETLTRQLTGQAWAKRRQRQTMESVQYVRSGMDTDLPASTPEMQAAMEQGAPVARSSSDTPDHASLYQAALAVPVVLRGEVLGALQVGEMSAAREWTEDDLTFMQAVADQVALALDNARLIEETEQRAERGRLVAEISSRMFAANDLETIVKIAGEELGRVLRVKQTTIKVRSELTEAAQPGNGQTLDQHA